ncbi:hypothetical protein BDQ17DRAFT_1256491 [Cyathus striatus]|nr:hypothetical protein BDQ17DRAFT_1256491 [Cyathus striatus]
MSIPQKITYGHFAYDAELDKTLVEANVIYWVTSLLYHSYAFIAQIISTKGNLPFDIPKIHFINAGLGIAQESIAVKAGVKAGTVHKAYLLEEFIDKSNGEFIKFINNGSAVPLLEKDEPLYQIAEFISFTQHIQYENTGALIMTSPYVLIFMLCTLSDCDNFGSRTLKDRISLFGDGNIGKAFDKFPNEHVCSKYCKWFSLSDLASMLIPPLSFEDEEVA